MRLLLDTHIWIWSVTEPRRLSSRVRRELQNPLSERWLSPISLWEALLLHSKGRIQLPFGLTELTERATAQFREAPITHEIAVAAHALELTHRDPADRFLAATAQVLGLTLVTADERLLGLATVACLANR